MARKKPKKSKPKKRKNPPRPSFWSNLDRFISDSEGINKSRMSLILLSKMHELEDEGIQRFITEKGQNVKKIGDTRHFSVAPKDRTEYDQLKRDRSNTRSALETFPKSLFVSMVTQFDVFFSSLVKITVQLQQNILNSEKPLTLRELRQFKKIDDAIDFLIEKEIGALSYDSRQDQLEWIGEKTKIQTMQILKEDISTFIELTQRRNLFVHCNGVVDDAYLTKCKSVGFKLDEKIAKGSVLTVSPEYFKSSSECLLRIAVKLTFLLWRKYIPDELEDSNRSLNNRVIVDFIKLKQYDLADNLCDFALRHFKFSNKEDLSRRLYVINHALAKKLNGDQAGSRIIIEKEDWSSCATDFELALAALKDEFDTCYLLMKKIGRSGKIVDEEGYLNDPIFATLRKQAGFATVFKKIYKKEYILSQEEKTKK